MIKRKLEINNINKNNTSKFNLNSYQRLRLIINEKEVIN